MNFFKRYNQIIFNSFMAVVLVSIGLFVLQLHTLYEHEVKIIREKFSESALHLDANLKAVTDHIEALQTQAEVNLVLQADGTPIAKPSLVNLLQTDQKNLYHLPAVPLLGQPNIQTQLTGQGNLQPMSPTLHQELVMAFSLNPLFKSTKQNIPGTTWVYYTSKQRFINLYPYKKDFLYSDAVLNDPYTMGLPERNPKQQPFWTNVYVDVAGSGLMVTHGAPVYQGDEFRGTVALDLTLDMLNSLVKSFSYPAGELLVVGQNNELLAHPRLVSSADDAVKSASIALPSALQSQFKQPRSVQSRTAQPHLDDQWFDHTETVRSIGGYLFLCQPLQDAPWQLVFWMPKSALVVPLLARTLWSTIAPLFGLSVMLAIANWITHREFINPAEQLVRHIQQESQEQMTGQPKVPKPWRPWFLTISATFQENRNLLQDLETRVELRTQALRESNDYLIQEIVERKQTERTLHQQREALEQTLQRLRQTQAQLIHTEKMSSLGQLVAGVAHEINNPVNFIHGNLYPAKQYVADLLKLLEYYQVHTPDTPPIVQTLIRKIDLPFLQVDLPRLLNSMTAGTERIQEIVRSLRNFSRMDEADCKWVDIHEGINSTLDILQYRFKRHPLEIQVVKDYADLPLVECYAGQLNQVFMNLLSNAIDAIEESFEQGKWNHLLDQLDQLEQLNQVDQVDQVELENQIDTHTNLDLQTNRKNIFIPPDTSPLDKFKIPTIYIKTQHLPAQESATDRIMIYVADNGIGIRSDILNRLFDPFFTTKPVGKGTGLGLAISHQIVVEKHQGSLGCISLPGTGTEFAIEIPIAQSEAET